MWTWIFIGVILAAAIVCCVGLTLSTRPRAWTPAENGGRETPPKTVAEEPTPAEAVDALLEEEATPTES